MFIAPPPSDLNPDSLTETEKRLVGNWAKFSTTGRGYFLLQNTKVFLDHAVSPTKRSLKSAQAFHGWLRSRIISSSRFSIYRREDIWVVRPGAH